MTSEDTLKLSQNPIHMDDFFQGHEVALALYHTMICLTSAIAFPAAILISLPILIQCSILLKLGQAF